MVCMPPYDGVHSSIAPESVLITFVGEMSFVMMEGRYDIPLSAWRPSLASSLEVQAAACKSNAANAHKR